MPDYKDSKIYKLASHETDDVYVGGTTLRLPQRKAGHKCDYKRWTGDRCLYKLPFEMMQYADCDIVLIEKYPCEDKMELNARVRYWVDELKCVNRINTGTCKLYSEHEGKEEIEACRKQRRDKRKAYTTEYYQKNKEKIKKVAAEWRKNNKERAKAYEKQRREEMKIYIAKWRQKKLAQKED